MLGAGPAQASTGGPELAEILGWDAADQKVYFSVLATGENDAPAGIFYFDLKSGTPGRARRVSWSSESYPDYDRRLEALKRRMRLLEPYPAPTIPEQQTIVEADTLRNSYFGPYPRYRVRVTVCAYDLPCQGGRILEVTALGDPSVRILRQYAIPGRKERIGIASFSGLPIETVYESQVPFLFPAEGETIRVAPLMLAP